MACSPLVFTNVAPEAGGENVKGGQSTPGIVTLILFGKGKNHTKINQIICLTFNRSPLGLEHFMRLTYPFLSVIAATCSTASHGAGAVSSASTRVRRKSW